eukprot:TRINITY_DN26560_c0_g1_i1.p1 TRINITY_DN26560_c0_g1~~TRINITY_DN26560_c0_g1_i1.p1  ORF type:complete len:630 (-),score=69.83 TRINITY_DN26560_c0_g1_i1:65-1954(-)
MSVLTRPSPKTVLRSSAAFASKLDVLTNDAAVPIAAAAQISASALMVFVVAVSPASAVVGIFVARVATRPPSATALVNCRGRPAACSKDAMEVSRNSGNYHGRVASGSGACHGQMPLRPRPTQRQPTSRPSTQCSFVASSCDFASLWHHPCPLVTSFLRRDGSSLGYMRRATRNVNGAVARGSGSGGRGRMDTDRNRNEFGHWRQELQRLEEMRARGYSCRRGLLAAHNSAIHACSQGQRWDLAVHHLFIVMLQSEKTIVANNGEPRPDVISCSSVVTACAKGMQWEGALAVLASAGLVRVVPDIIMCNAVLTACEKGGQWSSSVRLLRAMQKRDITPDLISYRAVVSACEKGGGWQWARALVFLREAEEASLTLNSVIYSAAISACEKGRQWEPALRLFAAAYSGPGLDTIGLGAAICACEGARQWRHVLELLCGAYRPQDVALHVVSYNSGVGVCAFGYRWVSAFDLLARMRTDGLQPDGFTYRHAVAACRGSGSEASATRCLIPVMKRTAIHRLLTEAPHPRVSLAEHLTSFGALYSLNALASTDLRAFARRVLAPISGCLGDLKGTTALGIRGLRGPSFASVSYLGSHFTLDTLQVLGVIALRRRGVTRHGNQAVAADASGTLRR